MVDLKECVSTGNMVADMIGNCIHLNERKGLHLETIYLSRANYKMFYDFVQKKNEEIDKDTVLSINNVDIKEGNLYMKGGMYWTYRNMIPVD